MRKRHTLCLVLIAVSAWAEKPGRSAGIEQIPGWTTNTVQRIEYGMLIEIEGYGARIDGNNESDIVLATTAFDLEAAVNDWMRGHMGLLWEQYSREDDNLDEAYVALGASEIVPYYFVGGKFYQPVGNFESIFITDPPTLELAEMNRTGAMVGYANDWVDLNIGAFNGEVKKGVAVEEDGDSTIEDFHAAVVFSPQDPVEFGAYWLSDLMETYNQVVIGEIIATEAGYEKVGAAGAFINGHFGSLTLNTEYVSALETYNVLGGRYAPAALNLELSAQVNERMVAGLGYTASDDLYATIDQAGPLMFGDKFPGTAFGAVVAYTVNNYAVVSVEYLHLEELDNDAHGDVFTGQLSLSF